MNLNEQSSTTGETPTGQVQTINQNSTPEEIAKFRKTNFESCNTKMQFSFEKAKTWWSNWLSNPTTLQKIMKNHQMDETKAKELIQKYKDYLPKIELEYFDSMGPQNPNLGLERNDWIKDIFTLGFIQPKIPQKLFMNCLPKIISSSGPNGPYQTMVHEIQHLLDKFITPINPYENVRQVFKGPNEPKFNLRDSDTWEANLPMDELGKLAQEFGVDMKTIKNVALTWLRTYSEIEYQSRGYACDESEKLSNIMDIRAYFNLDPQVGLDYRILKDYILLKKRQNGIFYLLACWASKGFPPLKEFVNNINSLAKQKTQNTNVGNV